MAQYGCVSITAKANENIVPLLFKKLTGNIPTANKCYVQFIAFETVKETELKINGIPNKVPSTGKFITPYDGDRHMTINSLSFNNGCSNLNIWFLY